MARGGILPLALAARVLLSMLLAACLINAPLCAARCARIQCAPVSPASSAEPCHRSSAVPSNSSTPPIAASSITTCITGELLFTAPRLQDFSVSIESLLSADLFQLNPVTPSNPADSLARAPALAAGNVATGLSPATPLRI